MPGDVRTGRDPPAERPLRCQARSPAGARHRRPAGARRTGRPIPAGSRSRQSFQGCRALRADHRGSGAGAARGGSRHADRGGRADGDLHHRAQRSPGARGGQEAAAQARYRAFRGRLSTSGHRSCRSRPGPRGRGPECRRAGGDAGRRRRAPGDGGGDGRGGRARCRRRQGAARQGRSPRRPPLRDGFDRASRHQAQLEHDDRLRHAPHDRIALPLFGIPAQGGQRQGRADRHRPRHALDPLSDGGEPRRR